MTVTVYVKLLDEGTDVWRPVDAEKVADWVYRLLTEHDDTETWEFETGSTVRVEMRNLESESCLVAIGLA